MIFRNLSPPSPLLKEDCSDQCKFVCLTFSMFKFCFIFANIIYHVQKDLKNDNVHVCRIFLKICHFLRSRSREIRTTARETLEKAALSLGACYFPFILKELRATLTRGYQVHFCVPCYHDIIKPQNEALCLFIFDLLI